MLGFSAVLLPHQKIVVEPETTVCPECGRTYVSGGTTNTTIRYNESNPYGQNQKSLDAASLIGGKVDLSA